MIDPNYTVRQPIRDLWVMETPVVRSFLATGRERALLINTGVGGYDCAAAVRQITDKPVQVVNLNSHDDHCGGDCCFSEICLHPEEFAGLRAHPFSKGLKLVPVSEGYVFDLGDKHYEVIDTPGYTAGSISLLCWEDRTLFGGDAISANPVIFSPVKESYDMGKYLTSMEKLLALSQRFDRIFPDHGEMPLDASYLQELIDCARKALDPTCLPKKAVFAPCALIPDIAGLQYSSGRTSILFSEQRSGPRYIDV